MILPIVGIRALITSRIQASSCSGEDVTDELVPSTRYINHFLGTKFLRGANQRERGDSTEERKAEEELRITFTDVYYGRAF